MGQNLTYSYFQLKKTLLRNEVLTVFFKKLIIFLCIFEDQKPIKSDSNLEFTVFLQRKSVKKKI